MRKLADLIHQDADRIGAIESRDTGKPLAQAIGEVHLGADFLTYFAGHAELPNGTTYPADAGYFVYSVREPYGVVGAISPWNYPFLLACWKTAPALAVGNSVVLKMAEQTPLSTAELGRLTLEAGMPAGVFNVVHGDGPTTGAALVAHPHVPKLTFTGSTVTGQAILRSAADHIKSVHLELGGKTPEHRLRRRRPRPGDLGFAVHGLLQHRPDLHERVAPARPAQPGRRDHRRLRRAGQGHQGRRPGRRRPRSSGRSSARSSTSA